MGLQAIGEEAVVGTLDLYAIRAMPGEVLIGAETSLSNEHPLLYDLIDAPGRCGVWRCGACLCLPVPFLEVP